MDPRPDDHERGGDWLAATTTDLANLGFLLRDGALPGTSPGPRLLVAIRDAPTLDHFDPEEVTYWAFRGERGVRASLVLADESPAPPRFSWGRIRVTDRVPVSNQFLSFGGTLHVARPDARTLVAAFVSPAPIVRWAGHSQGVDPFADDIGSFFARLMVPVDFQDGAEARIGAASPEALYAAAIAHSERRIHAARRLVDADPEVARVVAHEGHRLALSSPAAWAEGEALLASLEMG
ncbi:MAG: hypothetical protein ABIR11_12150 [Candidatus Limnocylindrales bacterium]